MSELSKYTDEQLLAELDSRRQKAMNKKGFVRCKDCVKPGKCNLFKRLKEGVYRKCEDYKAKK